MSKVKEMHIQQLENDFELDLNYQEWLRDNFSEPSELEINEMEQDLINKPHFVENRIISQTPLNNKNYNPNTKTGA